MPLATGARLGRYVIDDPVGAGGMGEVYRARDTRLDRIVAIKATMTATTLSGDSRITAVAVQGGIGRFDAAPPQALFPIRVAALERLIAVSQYAVAADGQSFVVNSLSGQALSRAVTNPQLAGAAPALR
jgi:serine/threonine protein kinase